MVTMYPMRGHIVRAMHGWAPYLPPGLFCGHTLSCEPHSEISGSPGAPNFDYCDFCSAEDDCECAGEDAGLDRPCCAGSDDDEPDDAGEGWPWPWASRAARGAYSAQR